MVPISVDKILGSYGIWSDGIPNRSALQGRPCKATNGIDFIG